MANGRRSGGDRVLESRHLVGLFFGVVVLCGVFFTLGYVMGRTQYGGPVHAAGAVDLPATTTAAAKSAKSPDASSSVPSEWDFYGKKADNHLETPAAAAASSPAAESSPESEPPPPAAPPARSKAVPAPKSSKISGRFAPPRIARGAIVLQLAALRHQSDALALAEAVQQKRFSPFIISPSADNLYRVQVGPYRDLRAAQNAQRALDHAGFRAIVKR